VGITATRKACDISELDDSKFDELGLLSLPTGTVMYLKHATVEGKLPATHLRPFFLFKLADTKGKCLTRALLLALNPHLIITRPRKNDGTCISTNVEQEEQQEEKQLADRYTRFHLSPLPFYIPPFLTLHALFSPPISLLLFRYLLSFIRFHFFFFLSVLFSFCRRRDEAETIRARKRESTVKE
jgi:hypothetical protein